MDAADNLRKDLTVELVKAYGSDITAQILGHIDAVLYKYEIKERDTALVPAETTIKNICEEYFACMMVDGVKPQGARNIFYSIRQFLTAVAIPLKQITANDVRGYIASIQPNVKPATLTCKERQINRFLAWCVREEYIDKNPMEKIKIAKSRSEERKPLSKTECIQLRNACETPREKVLIQFLLSTGCRISEAAKLKLEDIDIRSGTVSIKNAKFDKSRTVFTDAEFEVVYDLYMQNRNTESEYFFYNTRNGTGVTAEALRKIFNDVVKRSGIKRKISPHFIRHTFVTNMLRMGVAPNKVAAIAGHESIDTTCRVYGHLNLDDVKHEYERVHVA